ncbi:MAG: P-loop NTPase [Myxococcales bacterium]|nr:P-loop NTPase [Myxococcales bacterium]
MPHSCGHGDQADQARGELESRMQESLAKIRHKLLVMSGKGGVGKSTVAANIAVALANRGLKTGLLDVDLHGPSIPQMLGLTGFPVESDGDKVMPLSYNEHLSVLSMGSFLPNQDEAVIWRGPLKIGAIRQFLGDANWGELDFLVVDSPPGTGDEPLTVAQDMPGVRAIVVTTPQEVSLADVRKSINFCLKVGMPIVGVIENMSGYVCSKCGNTEDLFGSGGGEKMARAMQVPFLGKIPIDRKIVESGEKGRPLMEDGQESPAAVAYGKIVEEIVERIVQHPQAMPETAIKQQTAASKKDGVMRIAVPTAAGVLCAHFGHCERFALLTVDGGKIVDLSWLTPPPHEPGVIPKWLSQQGANVIIAGGMGSRAQGLFNQYGIKVLVGASNLSPEALVDQYLSGTLQTGENVCDH